MSRAPLSELSLSPYKGDLHIHSNRSDGREPPAHVAARCRQIGLDFVALTDHHQYAPSLEAIAAFTAAPVDLALYPGEEVHAPGNPIHIVNFGGRFSVKVTTPVSDRSIPGMFVFSVVILLDLAVRRFLANLRERPPR